MSERGVRRFVEALLHGTEVDKAQEAGVDEAEVDKAQPDRRSRPARSGSGRIAGSTGTLLPRFETREVNGTIQVYALPAPA